MRDRKETSILDEVFDIRCNPWDSFKDQRWRMGLSGNRDDGFFRNHLSLDKKAERERAKLFRQKIRKGFRPDFQPSF